MTAEVDDFVGLAGRTSAADRFVALGGPSGSGKSTLARWLLATHPGWRGPAEIVQARPIALDLDGPPRIVLVDEIVALSELAGAIRLLARGHRLIVCTHLPRPCFAPLRLRWRGRFVSTAIDGEAKIARALRRRGLRFTADTVRRYVRRFGPVYTEIDIVLERCPTDDFDRALRWFTKFHRLATTRV